MDYSRSIATAKRLISKFGSVATWYSHTNTLDGAKPWIATATVTTSTSVNVVQVSPSSKIRPTFVAGGTNEVPVGYQRFLVEVAGIIPQLKDTFDVGGKRYSVMSVVRIAPGDEVVFYEVEAVL